MSPRSPFYRPYLAEAADLTRIPGTPGLLLARIAAMLRRRLIPGSAVAALSVLLLAASAQPAALAGFEESVGKAVQDWRVPSLAVAGVHDGRVVVNKGYGTCRA
jgi:CubicO group peptidase (beta-lactamase class C family)